MSYTKKPCPGCGQPNRYRPADQVCTDCKKALENWNKHTAETAADIRKGNRILVSLPSYRHWWPGFYFGGGYARLDGFDELRDGMQQVCHEISYRLCEIVPWSIAIATLPSDKIPELFRVPDSGYPMSNGQSYDTYGLIQPEDWEMVRRLWDTTARFVHLAYLSGVMDGRDLIGQLARGEISAESIAERDIKLAARVQEAGRRKPLAGIVKKRRTAK